jgi:hypothetical protein
MRSDKEETVLTDNELIAEVFNANEILVIALFDGWVYDSERWIPPNIWIEKDVDGTNRSIQVRRHDKTFVSSFPTLKYDTSWDWIMPVWIKFRNLNCSYPRYEEWINSLQWYLYSSDEPKRFFERLVYAIKWYNENTKV